MKIDAVKIADEVSRRELLARIEARLEIIERRAVDIRQDAEAIEDLAQIIRRDIRGEIE